MHISIQKQTNLFCNMLWRHHEYNLCQRRGVGDSLLYIYHIVNTPAGCHDAVLSFLGLLMVDFDISPCLLLNTTVERHI